MMTYKEAVEKHALSFDELCSAAEQEGVSFEQMLQDYHAAQMRLLWNKIETEVNHEQTV